MDFIQFVTVYDIALCLDHFNESSNSLLFYLPISYSFVDPSAYHMPSLLMEDFFFCFFYCLICLSASLIPHFLLIVQAAINWILTFDCFMHEFDYSLRLTFSCL